MFRIRRLFKFLKDIILSFFSLADAKNHETLLQVGFSTFCRYYILEMSCSPKAEQESSLEPGIKRAKS